MNRGLKILLSLLAGVAVQAAHADATYAYTESFANPDDPASTLSISGLFRESDAGVLTSLSATVVVNGSYEEPLVVESMSAGKFIVLPDVLDTGVPLQINGYFIGLSGNRNSLTSCAQVFLDGTGCASWQRRDPSVPSQGLTDIRTGGADAGGPLLTDTYFAQTGALTLSAVPEAGEVSMLLAGLGLFIAARRRQAVRAARR